MQLNRVTVSGFKSFGDRVTVEFSPGVTAIVGPNGSGKSNLLDALRWATGGGRAREFRAEDKTELIFHGASGKKRLSRADVEVEMQLPDRRIKITRSLDRDGVTKLTLNGRNARFVDVDEALAGSGLGRGSLAIIGQGEVSGVLMADPPRLLSYVAEAAGVAQLSNRREQTVRRLDTAREHLARLEEKLAEDQARLDALASEAEDARRHRELTARNQQLRFTLIDARVASLERDVKTLKASVTEGESKLAAAREAADEAREHVKEARERDQKAEAAHREATALHAKALGDVRVAEHALEAATTRAGDLERQRERLQEERAELEQRQPPEAPTDDLAALADAMRVADEALDAARAALQEAQQEANGAWEARQAAEQQAAASARAVAQQQERIEAHARRRRELEARLETLKQERVKLEGNDPTQDEGNAAATVTAAEERLEAARTRLEEAHQAHATADADVRSQRTHVERLKAALENRQGYAEGPKQALASGISGILGSLADLLTVPDAYVEAVGLALGRRAEYIVTQDETTARKTLKHVRDAGGWVTLLPIDLAKAAPARDRAEALLGEDGVVGRAIDLIDFEDRYDPVVRNVLADTLIVETTEQAYALAKKHTTRPRMVTQDGSVFDVGGALSGGRRRAVNALLGAAKDLEDNEARLVELETAVEVSQTELTDAQGAFLAARSERDTARERYESLRTRATEWREAAAINARMMSDVEAELSGLESGPEPAVPDVQANETPDVSAARERHEAATKALEAQRVTEAQAREAAGSARHAHAIATERRHAYEQAQARFDGDLKRLAQINSELGQWADTIEHAWNAVKDLDERVARTKAALPDDLAATGEAREAARQALTEAESAVDAGNERVTQLSTELEQHRVNLARRETSLDAAREERTQFPDGMVALDIDERAARQELRSGEAELERIGDVNHRALDELKGLKDEHETRLADTTDARKAVDELDRTLGRLDRETTQKLREAVEGVRERFLAHIGELFGADGEGDITAEFEEGRPTGLKIRLQPPGKQTQALGLLSVGERTMGALAFLFALMGEEQGRQGLPVAVLDEVDAPLDEANIRRYRHFLERLAESGTQFVLITHQKATFEVADVIWGVTTERGVSRLFSIQKEADEPRVPEDGVRQEGLNLSGVEA